LPPAFEPPEPELVELLGDVEADSAGGASGVGVVLGGFGGFGAFGGFTGSAGVAGALSLLPPALAFVFILPEPLEAGVVDPLLAASFFDWPCFVFRAFDSVASDFECPFALP
jgi:hypothetical protein